MTVTLWALWQDTMTGDSLLQRITKDGATWTAETPIVCPEPLTNANVATLFMSTAILRAWPQDRRIVYFAGRSDVDGHLKAWRYNDHDATFTQLLDEAPSSGTWPFATGMWASYTGVERCYLVVGNGSGWGIFNNQNVDNCQVVWLSVSGGAFGAYGAGVGLGYSESNINHPNSLQTILVAESDEGDSPTVSHSVTWDGPGSPNTYDHWKIISVTPDGGLTWLDEPHPTGLQFLAAWVAFLSPSFIGAYLVVNGSSTGPYSFDDTNFGTLPPAGGGSSTGLGPYGHNTVCLPFQDADILLAFWSNQGQIDVHSPITGAAVSTATDAGWSSISPTACRVAESGGAAIALCEGNVSPTGVLVSEDYGSTWDTLYIENRAGLAVDFGEAAPPPPTTTVLRETLTFYDSRMFAISTSYYVAADDLDEARTNAQGIAGLIEALSNGMLVGARGPWTLPPVVPTPGADATYNMVEMGLRFVFLTDNGTAINLDVPVPTDAALLDDQELYAILNPAVADLTTGAITYRLANRGGLQATLFVGAMRYLRPRRTTQNIRTLDPSETSEAE